MSEAMQYGNLHSSRANIGSTHGADHEFRPCRISEFETADVNIASWNEIALWLRALGELRESSVRAFTATRRKVRWFPGDDGNPSCRGAREPRERVIRPLRRRCSDGRWWPSGDRV